MHSMYVLGAELETHPLYRGKLTVMNFTQVLLSESKQCNHLNWKIIEFHILNFFLSTCQYS